MSTKLKMKILEYQSSVHISSLILDCKVKTNDSFLFGCSRLIITEEISICLDLNKTLLSSIYSPVPGSDCWDRGLPWPIVNKLSVSLDPSLALSPLAQEFWIFYWQASWVVLNLFGQPKQYKFSSYNHHFVVTLLTVKCYVSPNLEISWLVPLICPAKSFKQRNM